MHQQFPSDRMWPRHLATAWNFIAKSLSMSPHACALAFEDNHLTMLKNTFHVVDGEAEFGVARLSLIVAISGGSKSSLLGMVESIIKSEEVAQAFRWLPLHGPRTLTSFPGTSRRDRIWKDSLPMRRSVTTRSDCAQFMKKLVTRLQSWARMKRTSCCLHRLVGVAML